MGHNAFGTCMVDALLAYDCAANPSHPVHGSARAMWDCLWQVASCEDVARCILPAPLGVCGASVDYTSCGNSGGNAKNADVRVECAGGIAFAENCALSGQTCALGAGPTGICAGASQAAGGLGCTGSPRCMGTRLHSCGSDGVDQGVDCASNGAGQCGGFPSASAAQWVACVASGDAGCAPSLAVTCAGGYASSCSSGIAESLDCTELFQTPDAGCMPGTLSPSFDWTSPCMVDPPACTGDACSSDGAMLTGCARGAPFTTSCTAQNLGPCRMISTDVGTAMHAACTVQ